LAAEVNEFAETPPTVPATGSARPAGRIEPLRSMLGLAGELAGAKLLGGQRVGDRRGVRGPQIVIGFTLDALGTSPPELVTAIQAQRHGETDLVVGNLFGSNLFNSRADDTSSASPPATNPPVPAPRCSIAMILTALLAWALLRRGLRVSRPERAMLPAAGGSVKREHRHGGKRCRG
jgi:cation:H+ antiporter